MAFAPVLGVPFAYGVDSLRKECLPLQVRAIVVEWVAFGTVDTANLRLVQ